MDSKKKALLLRNAQETGYIKSNTGSFDIDKEIALIEKFNIKIITMRDDDYPENLKSIYDPPIVLYVKGNLEKFDNLALAIVGSRRCTQYGLNTAERIGEFLSFHGITVVSGMARGIDTAAHKGTLKNNGTTVAVLGNGLATVYPTENKQLAEKITENGALVSEFPMETPPNKWNFPRRNRIISGLSKAVVVVEAAKKSGALITVDFALEQGREVFAVPGRAQALSSGGTNSLIREGARLIEDGNDIIEELGIEKSIQKRPAKDRPAFSDDSEKDIYSMLTDEPCDMDTIIEALTLKPSKARVALINMEMKGLIKQLPGKLYTRS